MSTNDISRRSFLKAMGWSGAGVALSGCDMPSTITLEEGKEEVVAYLVPEEYVIPGVGVWYASTCQQCPAGCGVHGRVREGRVLKVEGNPDSPVNRGKVCQMGQSSLQSHYNPDRIQKPLMRKGGELTEVSWEEAWASFGERAGAASGLKGDRFAWFTGSISGHQAVLLQAHLDAVGSSRHYVHEVINDAVGREVNQHTLGVPTPRYRFDKARTILSFGADFLGTWQSPVHFATEYAKFRAAPRGVLVQVEPKMTLTGASADRWVAIRPGTEGALAMGIAKLLVDGGVGSAPANLGATIAKYDLSNTSQITGISQDQIKQVASLLRDGGPSIVLVGASSDGHGHGYDAAAAAMALNIVLGNVGNTIVSGGEFPFPQLRAKQGNSRALADFAEAADKGQLDAVFFYGANPVYHAPNFMKLDENLAKIPFKVAFTTTMDETASRADLVIPLASALEDWGTHVAGYQAEQQVIGLQQPLMEHLYQGTPGIGDVLLRMLKQRDSQEYGQYADYYAYLQQAITSMPGTSGDASSIWNQTLQKGVLEISVRPSQVGAKAVAVNLPDYQDNPEYPLHLVPAARLGLWDGRHANIPWLQEAPDQITKVVWGSWAEMHPRTAAKLGLEEGDTIKITSDQGSVETQVYIYKGIHPDVVAVPLGQGHEEQFSRYAKERGVNPMKILSPVNDGKTGELALYATRVKVAKTRGREKLVRFGGNESQLGRKLAATVTSDRFERSERGA